MLLEPSRIKRGLGADPTHDPALVVGQTYSLVVTALGQTARHTFRVSDPVLEAVNETYWRLVSPTVGSLDPAVVHFDRVMDAAICEDEIEVLTPSGELVQTRVSLAPDGTAAQLIPSHSWSVGEHRLVVSERLEDVCGNRLGEALDHDVNASGRPRAGMINFTSRSANAPSSVQEVSHMFARSQQISAPLVLPMLGSILTTASLLPSFFCLHRGQRTIDGSS